MGARGRELAEKRFDRALLADHWVDTLESTLQGRSLQAARATCE
jgi:hypothetical protein